MTFELLLRYIHFICILVIAGSLTAEHVLLRRSLPRADFARLAVIDAIYGVAALVLLGAGLTLWLGGVGKASEFYSRNWVFQLKLGLFLSIGLISIYPTVFFVKQRRGNPAELIPVPAAVIWLLRLELMLLAVIPLLAVLMARGIGL
jgi:putative membrane protein